MKPITLTQNDYERIAKSYNNQRDSPENDVLELWAKLDNGMEILMILNINDIEYDCYSIIDLLALDNRDNKVPVRFDEQQFDRAIRKMSRYINPEILARTFPQYSTNNQPKGTI